LEARRRCGWLDEERRGAEKVVWVSRGKDARGERMATTECPVSLVSGTSRAVLDEWLAAGRLGGPRDLHALPARTVEAWLALEVERETAERHRDAD
jgi:hypothetical protein